MNQIISIYVYYCVYNTTRCEHCAVTTRVCSKGLVMYGNVYVNVLYRLGNKVKIKVITFITTLIHTPLKVKFNSNSSVKLNTFIHLTFIHS